MKQCNFLALFLKNTFNETFFIPQIKRKIINFAVICDYLADGSGTLGLADGHRRTETVPKRPNGDYGRQATDTCSVRCGSRNAGRTG